MRDPSQGDPREEGRESALDRRRFLQSLGAVGAAAALAGCRRLPVEHVVPHTMAPEEITPGVATLYAGTCTACPASCGLLMTVRDGRPVKLEGSPEHPLSRGGLCALGQGHLRGLYDPHRLRAPRMDGQPAPWNRIDDRVREGLARSRDAGREIAVLTPSLVGPTARAAVETFLASWGGGRLVELDPGPDSHSAALDAWEALTGRRLLPWPILEEVDQLVVLGADPLGTGFDPVAFSAAYAGRRAFYEERGSLRHLQVEGTWSLTGAAADERWKATAAERRALVRLLLEELSPNAVDPHTDGPARGPREHWAPRARALAAELRGHRGHALVLSGSDDPREQLEVALLNVLLEAPGATLDLERPCLSRRSDEAAAQELMDDLQQGRVGSVLFLESNPVETWPGGERLPALLEELDLAVAIDERPTDTAKACPVVAAAHHGLERWGDREPRRGVLTLVQPSVRPLFDTRDPMESILRWTRGSTAESWREHLRARWKREIWPGGGGPRGFDTFWARSLSLGEPAEGALTPPAAAAPPLRRAEAAWAALASPPAPVPDERTAPHEIELVAEVGRRDGRHAHVPWLRELPDPITRASWVPCARIAPEEAERLGVQDGDLLEITVGETSTTLPARLLPGQHPSVLGIPVGYGLEGEDTVGEDVNAYRLATVEGGRLRRAGLAATVAATGRREALPLIQDTLSAHGRPIVHQVSRPDEAVHAHHPHGPELWPDHNVTSPHWEMVIDLDACTGCSACVIACQAENNIAVVGPEEIRRHRDMYWLRIDRYFTDGDEPEVLFEPMLCHQCDDAPCETVCPVSATLHSQDGLNMQAYNRCVGTRYCANNCPYKVRRFNWFDNTYELEPLERLVLNPEVVVRDRGVMEKCTFCVQRIQAARIEGRKQGEEEDAGAWIGTVRTACQQSCPTRAISFGDGTDPQSTVSLARETPRSFQVLAELGVEPSVSYRARVRNRPDASGHVTSGEEGGHA